MNLWISPHSDDAVLFGAFTLMREHPLVLTVTDSYIQANRGENITAEQRRNEDIEAMKILNCSIVFGGIRDDIIDEWAVTNLLSKFHNFDTVYAPALQGGNKDHDLISKVALDIFGDKVTQYSTYAKGEWYTEGNIKVPASDEEHTTFIRAEADLKEKALACYQSQINLPSTKPHFEAIKGKPEWFL